MDTSSFKEFIRATTDGSHLRVETDLGDGFVRLDLGEAQRRQAKQDIQWVEDAVVELLRNSRDAGARNIFVASTRTQETRTITVIDDGSGIPKSKQELIFEPRVTGKLDAIKTDEWGIHGRGMALYSIRENATSAQVIASDKGFGTSIQAVFDTSSLPERADQSSAPQLIVDGSNGAQTIKGPRNIARTVYEFARNEKSYSVFFGSPSEIAATLLLYGRETLTVASRMVLTSPEVAIPKRLALAADPIAFAKIAHSVGLDMSDRTARRILDGDIAPIEDVATHIEASEFNVLTHRSHHSYTTKNSSAQDPRGLKMADQDIDDLKHEIKRLYRPIAASYFLNPDVDASISVSRDAIRITIPVIHDV